MKRFSTNPAGIPVSENTSASGLTLLKPFSQPGMTGMGARRSIRHATLVILALGLIWRLVRYVLAFPLWSDEAFLAVNFLTRDLKGLAQPLEFDQVAPPGFLYSEWSLVRFLGSGEHVLRLIPFLAGAATLILFAGFCRRTTSRRVSLIAVAIFASSLYVVRHGNEVKPYTVDLLVSLALLATGWKMNRHPMSARLWLLFLAIATLGIWCSYPAVFSVASVLTLMIIRAWRLRSKRLMAVVAGSGIITGLSFLAVVHWFAGPQAKAAAWLNTSPTWREAFPPIQTPWLLPWWLIDIHAGNMLAYPFGGRNFGSTLTLLLVMMGIATLWRRHARHALLLLLGPLAWTFVAAALHRYPYGTSVRVSIYMAPAFCLLAAEGAMSLLKAARWRARGPVWIAGALCLIPIVAMSLDIAMPYVRNDDREHRQLVRDLAAATEPRDAWLVFNGVTPTPSNLPDLTLARWLQRAAELRFYILSLAPVPTHWQDDPASITLGTEGKLWFLIHRHGNVPTFPDALLKEYTNLIEQKFGTTHSTRFVPLGEGSSLEILVYANRDPR